jgi:carbon-monoxide dehydrogenase small subunit
MDVNVKLNGKSLRMEVAPQDKLCDTLRKYGCPSVKTGCKDGVCGTCTVIYNGKPVPSCELLSIRCEGAEIYTVEGLGEEAKKVSEILTRLGGEGCGYCAPGFVVLACAAAKEIDNPTYDEVKEYLNGNLCRCTGYITRIEALIEFIQESKKEA